MSTILQDLSFAIRQLRRSPGFAVTVILTMALGIGANSTVFGVIDAVVLRPLNLPRPQQLVSLVNVTNTGNIPFHSYPDYRDLRDHNSTFDNIATYGFELVGLDYNNSTSQNWLYETSENYFDLLQIKPFMGRFFTPADAHGPNSMPYAVLSYDFWRAHTNSDPTIVGKVIQLNKHPFTVLGVAPPRFFGTEIFLRPDLFVPILNQQQYDASSFLDTRSLHNLFVIGRLKPGISETAATSDLNATLQQLAKLHKEDDGYKISLCKPGLGADYVGRPARGFLAAVMFLAVLVLIAACANLASLFSARAGDRARELALRLALGSTRRHLLRQLVVESLVISLLGGALGLIFGQSLLRALSQWRPSADVPIQVNVDPGMSLTLLALALSVACGVFFGLVPALTVWKTNAYQVIKQGNNGTDRRRRLTFRDVLLLLQVVLCAVLVTSSLVAVRGLVRSLSASYGFQPAATNLVSYDLNMAGYTPAQTLQFHRRAADTAALLPGVTATAFAGTTPLAINVSQTAVWREGTTDKRPTNSAAEPAFFGVSPGYFAAAQTAMLSGRDFTWHDDAGSPPVAVVNQTFARMVFGLSAGKEAYAVGRVFLEHDSSRQVVGIVEDGKYETLTEDPRPAFFTPIAQDPSSSVTLIVRSNSTATSQQTATALARVLKSLDPAVPLSVESWQQSLSLAIFPALVATAALGTMGALAAMLALTGIFGMASYSVSRRLRELGIRMALGAARRQVLRAAIGRPIQLLAVGSIVGLACGALASKLLGAIVYQATSRDPLVLFGTVLAMAVIGTLAAWLPARRALAVEPSRLLRED